MFKIINGRGQLGTCLTDKLKSNFVEDDIYIYHTWKLDTKSHEEQINEFNKFKTFVDNHQNDKIVFVSTYSERDDWYVYYKQLSEAYLLTNCSKCLIIKLPTFIGKHCDMFSTEKLKNGMVKPFGVMELISIEDAVDKIYELCKYSGKSKIIRVSGEKVSAELLYNIYKKIGVVCE